MMTNFDMGGEEGTKNPRFSESHTLCMAPNVPPEINKVNFAKLAD